MKEIQEQIQNLLCKLLEKGGNQILNNSKKKVEDRLTTYQDIVEETHKINSELNYIIAKIKDFDLKPLLDDIEEDDYFYDDEGEE